MPPVSFTGSIDSCSDAISVVDGTTLYIKLECGGSITLVAKEEGQLTAGLATAAKEAATGKTIDERLGVEVGMRHLAVNNKKGNDEKDASKSSDESDDESVRSLESLPDHPLNHFNSDQEKDDVESSFESIGEIGFTQELH